MTETKIIVRKLTASQGHTLTNGEAYGKEVYLGSNDRPENWREIADEEYAGILAEEQRKLEEFTHV